MGKSRNGEALCESGIKPYSHTAPEVFTIGPFKLKEIGYIEKRG